MYFGTLLMSRRIFMMAVRVAILAGAGFLALLFFNQSKMVYLPQRDMAASPASIGLRYEEVSFKTGDGVRLHGWFIPSESARGVLFFCHGNAGNISHRLDSISIFHRLGLSVFIFDYRGYGRSEGEPTEEGTYRDAEAAWDYLTQEKSTPQRSIVIFGRSLGGSIAARTARNRPAGALILESAFSSFREAAEDVYPWLPVRLLARYDYDTAAFVTQARCPVLIIHSRDDELIPFRHGEKLFSAAKDPKAFLEIIGGHNDGFLRSGKQYREGLDAFLSRYMVKS
jgi:fermentation-respiration switch protein FrsA (DUF1100 family)